MLREERRRCSWCALIAQSMVPALAKTFSALVAVSFFSNIIVCAEEEAVANATEDPPAARAVPFMERDRTTRLQIFLDQQLFGPGKIDGRSGEFAKKALIRYQRAHGLPESGVCDENIPLESVYPIYTFYKVEAGALKFVGDAPTQPSEQAK